MPINGCTLTAKQTHGIAKVILIMLVQWPRDHHAPSSPNGIGPEQCDLDLERPVQSSSTSVDIEFPEEPPLSDPGSTTDSHSHTEDGEPPYCLSSLKS